jgi:hypothetical protein
MRRKPKRTEAQVVGIIMAVGGLSSVLYAERDEQKERSGVLRAGLSSAADL